MGKVDKFKAKFGRARETIRRKNKRSNIGRSLKYKIEEKNIPNGITYKYQLS